MRKKAEMRVWLLWDHHDADDAAIPLFHRVSQSVTAAYKSRKIHCDGAMKPLWWYGPHDID